MSLVVDASVALKWVLYEPGREAADALRDEVLMAPAFWLTEAANALWWRVQQGQLERSLACTLLSELATAPVESVPADLDLANALQLACELRHPVYDCLYLALAIRRDTVVVTADRRFHAAVQGAGRLAQHLRLLTA